MSEPAPTLGYFLRNRLSPVDEAPVESISWLPGTTEAIDEETYNDKLEILPPRWMSGHRFAFGEGSGPFSIFWKDGPDAFFVTHLSMGDTEEFCQLARVQLHQ